jgi:hypothetical protein
MTRAPHGARVSVLNHETRFVPQENSTCALQSARNLGDRDSAIL